MRRMIGGAGGSVRVAANLNDPQGQPAEELVVCVDKDGFVRALKQGEAEAMGATPQKATL